MYCVFSLPARSGRFEAILANINGGIRFHIKIFVLSLFVCLRLGGHTQLPSVLVLSAPLSLPSVFNSVRNFGENQKLSGSSSQMNRKQIIPSGL